MTKRKMINEALKLLRLYWGYTQKDLAAKIDVSQSLISEIEKGEKNVTLDVLEKYSTGLGIRMSQLLFFAEEVEENAPIKRGRLILAEKALKILETLKPNEPATA